MALVGLGEDGTATFVLTLSRAWVPVLSVPMVGEALEAEDAPDLLEEVAGQAYGALRTQASAGRAALPVLVFQPVASGPLPVSAPLIEIAFAWDREEGPLSGTVLLPQDALRSEEAPKASEPPSQAPEAPSVEVARATFDDLGAEQFVGGDGGDGNLHVLSDVELEVTVELGRRRIPLADVLRLTTGSVIELEKLVGQPLDVYANGRLIAEGEAVVIDEQFGVRVTSLSSRRKPQKAFL